MEKNKKRYTNEYHQHIDNVMSCGDRQKKNSRLRKILIKHKEKKLEPIATRKITEV